MGLFKVGDLLLRNLDRAWGTQSDLNEIFVISAIEYNTIVHDNVIRLSRSDGIVFDHILAKNAGYWFRKVD